MPTAEKEATVAELTDILKRAKGLYLTDFTGLDVPSFTLLRKQLREESVSYLVIKNRLAKLAVKQAGVEGLDDVFRGPTGLD
ncbi:MAG: 50S ribosomal protein L10 [Gemmatimonadetes bacterium]|nr:50S ribosomal protein L10 [Gemmatimonadota bacterium]